MQHLILARPRSGKSYFAVANQKCETSLVRELENPDGRYIVTNLPYVAHEIEEFMARRGKVIDVAQRITYLEHEQVSKFWRYRGGGYVREVPDDPTEKTELHLLQNEEIFALTGDPMHKRGVLYILDEFHVYYPARQVMQRHPVNWLFQYGTQHGHFSDTIFVITQSLSYIDKVVREWTQDYIYLENERLRKVHGFRKGSGMVARFYQFPPTLGTEQPDYTENLPLDVEGYGKLYDTSGGAGIAGGGAADKGSKVKGLPLWSIWLMGGGAFLLLVTFLFTGKHFINRWLVGRMEKADTVQEVKSDGRERVEREVRTVGHVDGGAKQSEATTKQDDPPATPQSVTWTRYVQRGGKSFVYLSDGRVITTPSRIEYDGTGVVDFVDLDGGHWRLSRSAMQWGAGGSKQEEKK